MRIPNALTVPACVAGLLFHLAVGLFYAGMAGAGQKLLFCLLGFAVGFGILLVLWLTGGGGGGDVKLMGALGTWLGPIYTFQVFVVSAAYVAIGVFGALIWHSSRMGWRRTKSRYLSSEGNPSRVGTGAGTKKGKQKPKRKRRLVCYAVPVAFATWSVLAYARLNGQF